MLRMTRTEGLSSLKKYQTNLYKNRKYLQDVSATYYIYILSIGLTLQLLQYHTMNSVK